MSEQWFLIEMGCAECGDAPLALPRGLFDTEEEAKAAADGRNAWAAHPDGGSFSQHRSGGFWCAPVSSLDRTGREFGSEYDREFRPAF